MAESDVVGAFYSQWDSGRDCRAVVSVSAAGHVRIDLRYWQIGRAVPTRQGITVAAADWPAFAELVAIVSRELAAGRVVPTPLLPQRPPTYGTHAANRARRVNLRSGAEPGLGLGSSSACSATWVSTDA